MLADHKRIARFLLTEKKMPGKDTPSFPAGTRVVDVPMSQNIPKLPKLSFTGR